MNSETPRYRDFTEHYLQVGNIAWDDMQIGSLVAVEALDFNTNHDGLFGFRVLHAEKMKNGLTTVVLEMGENDFTFTRGDNRQMVRLPQGTIMREGVSRRYFPETNEGMLYLGGIDINRDYSFSEVLTPDGEIINSILVPRIKTLLSCPPDKNAFIPNIVEEYKTKIEAHNQKDQADLDEATLDLDSFIATRLADLFPDENERQEVAEIINTFHPSGRYKLCCLLEYANEDGLIEKYPVALKAALKEEFEYAPPVIARGLDLFPASARGFDMMIKEIGIRVPRSRPKDTEDR